MLEKSKKWVKEHKDVLVGTGLLVGSSVLMIVLGAKGASKLLIKPKHVPGELGDAVLKGLKEGPLTPHEIDELVFTDLAPKIEDAVLEKGLEKMALERTYNLGDNLSKFVTINVENVYGD